MKAAPPPHEQDRLASLLEYSVLDTEPEQAFDDITLIASQICACPIALISFVDDKRQWFKSRVGVESTETPRDIAFCAHAITKPAETLIVPDSSQDERFAENPLVTSDPQIAFYAGAPLVTPNGHALGTLCVLDRQPKSLAPEQQAALEALARQVMAQLELKKTLSEREGYLAQLEGYQKGLEKSLIVAQEDSLTDPLTQLPNRRALLDALEVELVRLSRNKTPLSVALLDVDHFKSYNDEFGHAAGDQALETIGARLREQCRGSDLVVRYGGEEFIALLAATDASGAQVMAERLRRAIESAAWPERPVTVSVGVTTWTEPKGDDAALIAEADQALYRAKEEGRNRVRVFTAELQSAVVPAAGPA